MKRDLHLLLRCCAAPTRTTHAPWLRGVHLACFHPHSYRGTTDSGLPFTFALLLCIGPHNTRAVIKGVRLVCFRLNSVSGAIGECSSFAFALLRCINPHNTRAVI